MRTRLILVRHGQTEYNREARLQGQIDIPLNVTGRRQAAVLAATVAENPPDMIISSPLSRAYDAARIVGEASGLDEIGRASGRAGAERSVAGAGGERKR